MYVLVYSIFLLKTLYLTKKRFSMCICSKEFKIFTLYTQRKGYYVEKPRESGDGEGWGCYFLHTGTYILFHLSNACI
jgi:hypothetical protein